MGVAGSGGVAYRPTLYIEGNPLKADPAIRSRDGRKLRIGRNRPLLDRAVQRHGVADAEGVARLEHIAAEVLQEVEGPIRRLL